MIPNSMADAKVVSIVDNQWGDTGKGKIVDYLAANWADVVARGTGGPNAGHTTVVNGKKRVFHTLPAGVIYSHTKNILGRGMVIDVGQKVDGNIVPGSLVSEIEELVSENMFYSNIFISKDAQVILPYHIDEDKAKNQSLKNGGIGSTGRGVGPAYRDKIDRKGFSWGDFKSNNWKDKILPIMRKHSLSPKQVDDTMDVLENFDRAILGYVCDTDTYVRNLIDMDKKVLLEGAQGLLLSIEYGMYPYVTSSDCSASGTAIGAGLNPGEVDITYGIVKFPYMTKVGGGPMPTELGGIRSELHCQKHNLKDELSILNIDSINGSFDCTDQRIKAALNSNGRADNNDFRKGIALRLKGNEYGATTKRPRRTGWTDLALLKYAANINGPNIILTKVDVASGMDTIKLGIGYEGVMPHESIDMRADTVKNLIPIYREFRGFHEDISSVQSVHDLPKQLHAMIQAMQQYADVRTHMISVGPDQKQTLIVDPVDMYVGTTWN